MTREEKIKVLAKLDGWTKTQCRNCEGKDCSCDTDKPNVNQPPNYLTRYDAIIPLVKKCWEGQMFEPDKFYKAIPNYYPHILTFIQHTSPQELADALIKAVGKWRE